MYADMLDSIEFLKAYDSDVAAAMGDELARQRRNLELIASENLAYKSKRKICYT